MASLTDVDLEFPWQTLGIDDGIIGLFVGVVNDSSGFFFDVKGARPMTPFTINTQWKFGKEINGPLFRLWHSGMTTHTFDVYFSVKMGVVILVSRG